jgi:hypothetical protein
MIATADAWEAVANFQRTIRVFAICFPVLLLPFQHQIFHPQSPVHRRHQNLSIHHHAIRRHHHRDLGLDHQTRTVDVEGWAWWLWWLYAMMMMMTGVDLHHPLLSLQFLLLLPRSHLLRCFRRFACSSVQEGVAAEDDDEDRVLRVEENWDRVEAAC